MESKEIKASPGREVCSLVTKLFSPLPSSHASLPHILLFSTGFKGFPGVPGHEGSHGLPGDPSNVKGYHGDPGAQGLPGIKGLPGPTGNRGITGFKGMSGNRVSRAVLCALKRQSTNFTDEFQFIKFVKRSTTQLVKTAV